MYQIFDRMIEYMSSRKLSSNGFKCYYMLVLYDKGMHKCWLKIDFPSSVCRDVYHMLNLRSIDVHK